MHAKKLVLALVAAILTVRRTIALAQVPAELPVGAGVEVDVLGELVPAVIAPDVLYDPTNERVSR